MLELTRSRPTGKRPSQLRRDTAAANRDSRFRWTKTGNEARDYDSTKRPGQRLRCSVNRLAMREGDDRRAAPSSPTRVPGDPWTSTIPRRADSV